MLVEVETADDTDLQEYEGDTPDQKTAKKALLEKRLKKDRRCKMLMVSRIHNSQLEYVQDLRTPKQILDALVRVFKRKIIASRMFVQRKIERFRPAEGFLPGVRSAGEAVPSDGSGDCRDRRDLQFAPQHGISVRDSGQ